MQVCFGDRPLGSAQERNRTWHTVPNSDRPLGTAQERNRTPAGFRDAALIAILRGTGLRQAEVVKLNMSDFNNDFATEIHICTHAMATNVPSANHECSLLILS